MKHSNFNHINDEYPHLAKIGQLAEHNVFSDPATSLSKLRLLIEKLTEFIIEFEQIPYMERQTQHERLTHLDRKGIIPGRVIGLFHKVRMSGNRAAHSGEGSTSEAKYMLRQSLKIIKWFYSMYENEELNYTYREPVPQRNDQAEVQKLEAELAKVRAEVKNFKDKLNKLSVLSPEEIEARRQMASLQLAELEEDEEEARERIDLQLRESGWECDTEILNHKEFGILPENNRNMAIAEWPCGAKYADYALFVGKKLVGVVEAKKQIKNVSNVLDEARNYSIAVDGLFDIEFPDHANDNKYRVPFMFASNGGPEVEESGGESGIWFWDGRKNTNREVAVKNWYSPDELLQTLKK